MTAFFGGDRGRVDPELVAGNRRTRLHYARDVNDERALAEDGRPAIRRGRHWTLLAVAVLGMAVLAVAGGRDDDEVRLAADCGTPAIGVSSSVVTAGTVLRYRLTGPDASYVVTLDGAPVRGDAGSTVSYTSTEAGPALRLQQCLSPTLALAAPAGDGPHELAVLRVATDGSTVQAAAVTVTVQGTR